MLTMCRKPFASRAATLTFVLLRSVPVVKLICAISRSPLQDTLEARRFCALRQRNLREWCS
jgi:hypothetical protein